MYYEFFLKKAKSNQITKSGCFFKYRFKMIGCLITVNFDGKVTL